MKMINRVCIIFIVLYLFESSIGGIIPELKVAKEIFKNAKPSETINEQIRTPNPTFIEPANDYTTKKPAQESNNNPQHVEFNTSSTLQGRDFEQNTSTLKPTSIKPDTEPNDKQETSSTTVQSTVKFTFEPTKPTTEHKSTTEHNNISTPEHNKSTTEHNNKSTTEHNNKSTTESTINKHTTNKQRTDEPHKHHKKQKTDDLPFVFPIDTTKELINKEINKIKKILNNSEIFININSYSNVPNYNKYNIFKPYFCKYKPLTSCNKYLADDKIYMCKEGKYFNPETCDCDLKENVKSCENGTRKLKESIESMDENSKEEDSSEIEVFNVNDKTFILDFFNIFKHIFN